MISITIFNNYVLFNFGVSQNQISFESVMGVTLLCSVITNMWHTNIMLKTTGKNHICYIPIIIFLKDSNKYGNNYNQGTEI